MKCLACGSESLVKGKIGAGAGSDNVRFRPEDNPYLKTIFGLGSKAVRAYGCVHCGHLQLAVELDEEDSRRFLEFEGQQPSVLERLNEGEGGQSERDR